MAVSQGYVDRALDMLGQVRHDWLHFENRGPDAEPHWLLKVGDFVTDNLAGGFEPVFIEWQNARSRYRLMREGSNQDTDGLSKMSKNSLSFVSWVYPFNSHTSRREVSARLGTIGCLLLLTKEPSQLPERLERLKGKEGELEKYRKELQANRVTERKVSVTDIQAKRLRLPKSQLTETERRVMRESGPTTSSELNDVLRAPKPLYLEFGFSLFGTKGNFLKLFTSYEEDGTTIAQEQYGPQIAVSLSYLIDTMLDPKGNVSQPITNKALDQWVDFVVKERLPVWVWEYITYSEILDTLHAIGISVIASMTREFAELSALIQLKKASLATGRKILLEKFRIRQDDKKSKKYRKSTMEEGIDHDKEEEASNLGDFAAAMQWLHLPHFHGEADNATPTHAKILTMFKDMKAELEDEMDEGEVVADLARELISKKGTGTNFGLEEQVANLVSASATVGYSNCLDEVIERLTDVKVKHDKSAADDIRQLERAGPYLACKRPTREALEAAGTLTAPGNPYEIMIAHLEGHTISEIKRWTKMVAWELFVPDIRRIDEVDLAATVPMM